MGKKVRGGGGKEKGPDEYWHPSRPSPTWVTGDHICPFFRWFIFRMVLFSSHIMN